MIRDYEKRDREALKAIHSASMFDYVFPDLDDPLFVVRKTVEEDGKAVQGLLVKLQGEVYLYVQADWATPEERWARLVELTDAAKKAAWEKGLDSLVCVVPPEIAASFEKRLKQIGMVKNLGWPRFTFDLTAYTPKEVRVESENRTVENNREPVLRD
jgi:hypothetical protein